jgi:hypothetical protein
LWKAEGFFGYVESEVLFPRSLNDDENLIAVTPTSIIQTKQDGSESKTISNSIVIDRFVLDGDFMYVFFEDYSLYNESHSAPVYFLGKMFKSTNFNFCHKLTICLDGTNLEVIKRWTVAHDMKIYDGYIWLAQPYLKTVNRMGLDGSYATSRITSQMCYTEAIAVDGRNLYFIDILDDSIGHLRTVDLDTGVHSIYQISQNFSTNKIR